MDATPHIVLASVSPRRRRLLSWLELPFRAAQVETPESLDSPLAADPPSLAISLAEEKARAALDAGLGSDSIVLTFDTIVALGREVLGKPADADDAWRMLRGLSGRVHQVHTACSVTYPGAADPYSFAVSTNVQMHELSDARIREWMACGEFMGCAGAYNIEGQVAAVTLDECYQNVAGLPLCHLCAQLRSPVFSDILGVRPTSPVARCDCALGRTCRLGPTIAGTV